jgi:hypothetical protein
MTTRISGETDFPCIYGDKVGLGRIYVKLDGKGSGFGVRGSAQTGQASGKRQPLDNAPSVSTGQLDFDAWIEGIKNGRSYVCDGLSHLTGFGGGLGVGDKGQGTRLSRAQAGGS